MYFLTFSPQSLHKERQLRLSALLAFVPLGGLEHSLPSVPTQGKKVYFQRVLAKSSLVEPK
jgi:hypothetical protein